MLGVPFEQNHQDAAVAESPLAFTSMFWGWQAGYKFLRLEGETEAGNVHRIHLGSTGCEGTFGDISRCDFENRAYVELRGFDPLDAPVVFDLERLFSDTDLETNAPDTPLGCMSEFDDPDCDGMFRALGLRAPPQSVFRSNR